MTDLLKASDQMKWARLMNNCKAQAEVDRALRMYGGMMRILALYQQDLSRGDLLGAFRKEHYISGHSVMLLDRTDAFGEYQPKTTLDCTKKFRVFLGSASEILLHRAAKKFFDESGLEKLPTVKSLQAEYAALLSEKKAAYADYRSARNGMRELLTIKANVDRMMGYNQQEREKDAVYQEER